MVKETKTESPVLFMSEASFSYAGGHSGAGVEGISLSLGKGEVALLCGPSGCGKTTVTRLANGLAPHFYEGTETGTVRVCGLDVAHAELWETARFVGSVFQNPKTQFYNVDVRGEVAFGCETLIRTRRYRTAGGRFGKGVQSNTPDRRKPLFSLGRSEAARGVRKRRGYVSRARRAGRAVV